MCKEEIKKEAKLCPHCRTNLEENEEWKAVQVSNSGCAGMLIFTLIAFGVIQLF